jgi:hypothetical protein
MSELNREYSPQEEGEMKQKVLEVLRAASQQINQLQEEAGVAIRQHDDLSTYREKLKAKTDLIISLPNQVQGVLGTAVPSKELTNLIGWLAESAKIAEEAKGAGSAFPMAALLTGRGSKEGDSNDLEKKIASLDHL